MQPVVGSSLSSQPLSGMKAGPIAKNKDAIKSKIDSMKTIRIPSSLRSCFDLKRYDVKIDKLPIIDSVPDTDAVAVKTVLFHLVVAI